MDELEAETGTELYVVYVDSFDGTDGAEWAGRARSRPVSTPTTC